MGAGSSRLSDDPLPPGSSRLAPEQLRTLRTRFAEAARGGSGGASTAAISDLLALPHLEGVSPLLSRVFAVLDSDGDGSLTLAEFVRAAEVFAAPRSREELSMAAFHVADTDKDGRVGAEDLQSFLAEALGGRYAPVQLARVARATIDAYDGDGDGRLTFSEFSALLSTSDLDAKFTFSIS